MKKILILLTILSTTLLLASCKEPRNDYEQITPQEAKQFMESKKDLIVLDVRTSEEYNNGHIKNAILIPDYEIKASAEQVLKDKNQLILVYCRSGRRSKKAAKILIELGYTNVKEFGGIIDWPYETVK